VYELSQAAAQDIEAILDRSIIDFGPIQTERYFESLSRCLGLLGENPGMGGTADEIRPGYRRFGHQSHVIFYRCVGDDILVVRVLHKRMDASRQFQDDQVRHAT